ncbi:VanZ family protein [Fictibacillus sp. b24]|uniref:VanZ family protein n=1 Tax=Fictibacillus sp. b24 TaxID=3055863 RepID=UPI0025A2F4D0|nr:VanZ family protein [Fictibacillus sp. b24]MDM5314926.1 VanZ family protein [Fictibacillus sp. b24]
MKKYVVGLLVLVWVWFIYYFTASPNFTSGQTGAFIQETGLFHLDIGLTNSMLRKAAHVILFGSFAIILYVFLNKFISSLYAYILAWELASLAGMLDEFHQQFVPDRGSSGNDMMLDSFGAFLFLTFYVISIKGKSSEKNRVKAARTIE